MKKIEQIFYSLKQRTVNCTKPSVSGAYRVPMKCLLFACSIALLAACSDNSPGNKAPIALDTPVSDTVLTSSESLTIQFNEVLGDTVTLGGDMAEDGADAVVSGDSVTISPTDFWQSGASRSLTVEVEDEAGETTTLDLNLSVRLLLSNFQSADQVLGQSDFVTRFDEVDQTSFSQGYDAVAIVNDYLYISDTDNNRVLGYNSVPTENEPEADFVLGQSDFDSSASGAGSSSLNEPQSIDSDGKQFFIVDYRNSRVLVYNSQPVASPGIADFVLGQDDFGENAGKCEATSLNRPSCLVVAENKLLVTDSFNHRVLIWNLPITTNAQTPDLVLGQSDLSTCAENDDNQDGVADSTASSRTFDFPAGIWSDGQKLVVNDQENSRTLIWETFPTINFQPADLVLGQSGFTNNTPNDNDQDGVEDDISAKVLNRPYDGVDSNGVQLSISDYDNSRILIWNSFPTESFQAADVVLGQQDMTLGQRNDDNGDGEIDSNPTARTLYYPTGCRFYSNRFYVTDKYNFRVVVYTSL